MKQRRRIYCSSAQRSEIWDLWQPGESMSSIVWHWPPGSMSIFVTLGLPGSAARTKTPTDCCANTFRVAPICPYVAKLNSAR
jgi:hypothetical protein